MTMTDVYTNELEAAARKHAVKRSHSGEIYFMPDMFDSYKAGAAYGYTKGRAESQAATNKLRAALTAIDRMAHPHDKIRAIIKAVLKDSQGGGMG